MMVQEPRSRQPESVELSAPGAASDARSSLERRAVLQDHFHRIEHVHFIERGVASLYARTRADGPVEVAQVGPFGFVGAAAILGNARSPHRCLMHVPGEALRIGVPELLDAMDASPTIRHHLLAYVHALLVQNAQAALCNGRHDVEQRLCRWLLLAADRLDDTVIPITHDMLSMNLGVRRAGVTSLLGRLQKSGVIAIGRASLRDRRPRRARAPGVRVLRHHRGRVPASERARLPRSTCSARARRRAALRRWPAPAPASDGAPAAPARPGIFCRRGSIILPACPGAGMANKS